MPWFWGQGLIQPCRAYGWWRLCPYFTPAPGGTQRTFQAWATKAGFEIRADHCDAWVMANVINAVQNTAWPWTPRPTAMADHPTLQQLAESYRTGAYTPNNNMCFWTTYNVADGIQPVTAWFYNPVHNQICDMRRGINYTYSTSLSFGSLRVIGGSISLPHGFDALTSAVAAASWPRDPRCPGTAGL